MAYQLGTTLCRLRRMSRLSQGYLAQKVGIRQQSYWKYEHNLSEPELEIIVALAEQFCMTVDELLEFDVEQYPEIRLEDGPRQDIPDE